MKDLRNRISTIKAGQTWKHKSRGGHVKILQTNGDRFTVLVQRVGSGVVHKTNAKDIIIHYQRI